MRRLTLLAALCLMTACSQPDSRAQREALEPAPLPIIDMHAHAAPPTFAGEPGAIFFRTGEAAPLTEAAIMRASLEAMERNNIVLALTSGPLEIVGRWQDADPDRILASPQFPVFGPWPEIADLRQRYDKNALQAIGEITAEYAGIPADGPELEPYYELAEELGIPVAIHLGQGPPETVLMQCCPDFSLKAGSPLRLEPVLQRHRDLRIYVCHMGRPFLDEMIAIMNVYPRVYVDISGVSWAPADAFREYVLEFIRCDLGDRLMFGSDQMIWPGTIDLTVDAVASAEFLTDEQKRDIFYNNAARFLGLSEEEIARHHGS